MVRKVCTSSIVWHLVRSGTWNMEYCLTSDDQLPNTTALAQTPWSSRAHPYHIHSTSLQFRHICYSPNANQLHPWSHLYTPVAISASHIPTEWYAYSIHLSRTHKPAGLTAQSYKMTVSLENNLRRFVSSLASDCTAGIRENEDSGNILTYQE